MKKNVRLTLIMVVLLSLVTSIVLYAKDYKKNEMHAGKEDAAARSENTENMVIDEVAEKDETNKLIANMNSDQYDIFNKMLNSIDNYQTVQGKFKQKRRTTVGEQVVNYKVDLENKFSWEEAREDGLDYDVFVNQDEITEYNNVEKSFLKSSQEMKVDSFADMPVEERIGDVNGENPWVYRENLTGLLFAKSSLFPQEMVFGFLSDFSKWAIKGEDNYSGRNCIIIEGVLDAVYGERFNVSNFILWVDAETGILLKYEGMATDGSISEYLTTNSITINEAINSMYAEESKYEGYKDVKELRGWNDREKANN